MIIIKKGTCDSAFRLKNGHNLVLRVGAGGGDYLNIVSDADYECLLEQYGSFFKPRIRTDKNPTGCFIVSEKAGYAKDFSEEVGKVEDGSAPIDIDKPVKKRKKK